MGIRIHRNTWSAPLQLIDCWLPAELARSTPPAALSQAASRFVKAGWLHRKASNDAVAASPVLNPRSSEATHALRSGLPRVARHVHSSGSTDGRVRVSGRLADVCAELERLTADHGRRG